MKYHQTRQLLTSSLLLTGLLATNVSATVHYVNVNSANSTPPYTSWVTAATNIQDAVDAAVAGDEIVVTNGIYATGGRATVGDTTTNRVAVDKSLSLRSVNGPQCTMIDGGQSIRCVYLTNGASLSGFTLTHGRASEGRPGGGVYCESTAVVFSCIITANVARWPLDPCYQGIGGGAFGGTLNNCTFIGNDTVKNGGGAYGCTLNNCSLNDNGAGLGGGAYGCILSNCLLNGNGANRGGGAYSSTLNNCLITSNSAVGYIQHNGPCATFGGNGGGVFDCTLTNCTLVGNSARRYLFDYDGGPYGSGGGAANSTLKNCIVYFNYAGSGPNTSSSTLNYCCTTSDPGGLGNITNAPLFVDQASGNLRLQSNSPCINAGRNAFAPAGPDLDGNPRIVGGTADLGAYEFQSPASIISYAWLQHFNLPINPSTDTADPDGDGVNNYREWLAGSDPTNPFSFPPLLTLIPYGANVILTWPTNAFGFTLQSTTNLGAVWSTNSPGPVVIGGQNVIINPRSGPQQFYRLSQ